MSRFSSPFWYSPVRSTVPFSGYTLPMTSSRGYFASPRPERLWNVVMATSRTPPHFFTSSSALSATATPHVTQLGDLTSDLASSSLFANDSATASRSVSGFASGTESGLAGSKRACGEMEKTFTPAAPSASSISPCSGAMNESATRHSRRAITSSTELTRTLMNSCGNTCGFHRSAP